MHKALDGNKNCQTIVERWIVEYPELLIGILDREISRKLGYEPTTVPTIHVKSEGSDEWHDVSHAIQLDTLKFNG